MGISAWTSNAEVLIGSRKVKKAYEAIVESCKSGKLQKASFSAALIQEPSSVTDMAAFLDLLYYKYEKSRSYWKITDCDMDKMNDEFCGIFEAIAPHVKEGSYIKIEDEEECHLLMAFDGKEVKYFGDAY